MKILNISFELLADFIEIKNGIVKPRHDNYEKSIMMLNYYKNNLAHILISQANVILAATGEATADQKSDKVYTKVQYLRTLFDLEFHESCVVSQIDKFNEEVDFLVSRQTLMVEGI